MPTTDMTALGAPRRPATAALLGPAAAASSPLRSTSHQPAAARLCAGALCRPAGSPPGAGSGFGSFRKGSGRAGGGRRAFQKDLETAGGGVTRAPPRAARQYCGGARPAPLRGPRALPRSFSGIRPCFPQAALPSRREGAQDLLTPATGMLVLMGTVLGISIKTTRHTAL